ncbi:MAG TPA: cyclase family protein [Gemmatimonadaceae bacterium]|nr:cyclase family protein [Gemmatimonadaceae bacterium]
MRELDISIPMGSRTPEWPGDQPFSCGWTMRLAGGGSVNLSAITTSPHVGTHADAPLHVHDGWLASHELPLRAFAGRAFVCSVDPSIDTIESRHLTSLPPTGAIERLLVRTQCTVAVGAFPKRWPVLSVPAVRALLARGLVLLGVDTPSLDGLDSKTLEVHKALFSGGAFNLENLDLRSIDDGEYELVAYPVLIADLDAAPVRAVLRTSREG